MGRLHQPGPVLIARIWRTVMAMRRSLPTSRPSVLGARASPTVSAIWSATAATVVVSVDMCSVLCVRARSRRHLRAVDRVDARTRRRRIAGFDTGVPYSSSPDTVPSSRPTPLVKGLQANEPVPLRRHGPRTAAQGSPAPGDAPAWPSAPTWRACPGTNRLCCPSPPSRSTTSSVAKCRRTSVRR